MAEGTQAALLQLMFVLCNLLGFRLHAGSVADSPYSHNVVGFCRSFWKLCSLAVVSVIERESDRSDRVWVEREEMKGLVAVECSAVPRGREKARVRGRL